jgi:hypothetical protein
MNFCPQRQKQGKQMAPQKATFADDLRQRENGTAKSKGCGARKCFESVAKTKVDS